MNKLNKKGFTLIEMLVVIAIIAILVAIIVPTVASSTMKAKGAADAANFRSLQAEAAIDWMNGSGTGTIEKTLNSKVFGTSGTIIFSANSGTGNLEGVVNIGGADRTLQDFVTIAETGKKPS